MPIKVGTCESFFLVRIESRIESAVYTTQAVIRPDGLQAYRNMLTTSIVNERE